MIELSKIRLVNWYGFSSMTVPIGAFTLIAGKNGNGKSVLLDAIKYALYGDTVFNKSTENKGSRTIPSYTRGLLDATANSYMRPADKMPNVYTHIVLEMHEKELDKYFILGTVIETNSGNGIITQRYVIEEKHLNEIEHTYEKGTDVFVYSAGELQKKYGLKMFSATEGLAKFMQRTGLRLNEGQLAAFRRKLRSIMSYDPNAKIDQFIRESVLEEKKVDFTKLVETKSNIDKLTEIIMTIDSEISELENILRLFEEVERKQNVILTDDIKIAYKRYRRDKKNIEKAENQMILASKQIEEDDRNLKIVEDNEKKTRSVLEEASYNLNQMDCAKAIREAENVLSETEKRKDILMTEKKKLLELENRISELMNWMHMEGKEPENREILSSLSLDSYSKVQKEKCVDDFISFVMYSNDRGEELEKEIKRIISKIVSSNDKEQIERFADYRNYMNYEILVSNDDVLNKAKLSKQSGYNSGAEVQIPYMLILLSALLMIYNDKTNSTRLVFIDEPFAKMDPTNVRTMLKFMKSQKLQMIFCAPDKTELIGNECQVILPVLRTKPDLMEIGIVEIHEGVSV